MAYSEQRPPLTLVQVSALLALSLRVDLQPGPGGARITPLGLRAAAALLVLGDSWSGARLAFVALGASRQISAHCDPAIAGRRFHIPLAVNAGCWSFHGGLWQRLTVGRCYEMDPTVEHGAVNWGATTRLHLIADLTATEA